MRLINGLHNDQNQPVALDSNLADIQAQNAAAAALNASVRRPPQKPGNGHLDDHSPISRAATPNMYAGHMLYQGLDDHHLQQPLGGFGAGAAGNGAPSPLNGEAVPQTPEELLALNSGLKTRIDELEVINDLIQRRLQHYEAYGSGPSAGAGLVEGGHEAAQLEAQLRAQVDALSVTEAQLRSQLDESHRRENNLKRRLDEMELELKDTKESLEAYDNGRAKKPRLDEPHLDEPRLDEPHLDEPRLDEHRPDEHRLDEPRLDEPRLDGSRIDEPRIDEPHLDEPRLNEPAGSEAVVNSEPPTEALAEVTVDAPAEAPAEAALPEAQAQADAPMEEALQANV